MTERQKEVLWLIAIALFIALVGLLGTARATVAIKFPRPSDDWYRAEPGREDHEQLTIMLVSEKRHVFLPKNLTIPASRVRQIQTALRERGYQVPLTGRLDSKTLAAMKQIQKQNGWQTRRVPDARLLDLLGLGAKHNYLGNTTTEALK